MNGNSKVGFPRWITAEGTIDLAKLSIDGILKQAIDPEFERFRSACVLLGSMANAGRQEAGLYLIGLLAYYASDLQRLEVIAGQLGHFSHESSANALLAEIRRVRSSNTTRCGCKLKLGDAGDMTSNNREESHLYERKWPI
jgi:hypothetical protein